jgi:hypothetical protein
MRHSLAGGWSIDLPGPSTASGDADGGAVWRDRGGRVLVSGSFSWRDGSAVDIIADLDRELTAGAAVVAGKLAEGGSPGHGVGARSADDPDAEWAFAAWRSVRRALRGRSQQPGPAARPSTIR